MSIIGQWAKLQSVLSGFISEVYFKWSINRFEEWNICSHWGISF